MYDWLTNTFNNREIAIAIWLGIIFAISCILKLNILGFMKGIAKAISGRLLFVIFVGPALWLTCGVFILNWIGWWTLGELKLTIFWLLFPGAVLLRRTIQNQDGLLFFRQAISSQFKAIAALEFAAVFYSFSLPTELWFVPVVAFLSVVLAMSETKSEHAPTKKLLEWVFVCITLFLVYHFVTQTISAKGAFWNVTTAREVTIPILLSIWALPYSYVLYCWARWGEASIPINRKPYHCNSLRDYARREFCWALFFRPVLLKRAVRQFNIPPAKTEADIHDIIQQVRQYENNRSNPPPVPEELGWCPYAAEAFLSKDGLKTEDFHNSGFDDEWLAVSNIKYLGDSRLFGPFVYCTKGKEGFVETLQLEGQFDIDPALETGIGQMQVVATNLIRAAMVIDTLPKSINDGFDTMSDVNEQLGMHKVYLKFVKLDEGNVLNVKFTISTKG